MSFIMQAPVPAVETTSVLPSPLFNNAESRRLSVEMRRSINNTKRSYVKSNARSRVTYSFKVTRHKGEEVKQFILAYYRSKIRWTDHLGDVWEGYFTSNPFSISGAGRASGSPGGEYQEIAIQLEGIRLSYATRDQC